MKKKEQNFVDYWFPKKRPVKIGTMRISVVRLKGK